MPPPSPVWAGNSRYNDALFWVELKVGKDWYSSEKVLLKVKGAAKK